MVFSELEKEISTAQGYLIGMSLWFYAYANLQYLWLLLFSCLIGWLLSCLPEKIFSEKGKKVLTGCRMCFFIWGCWVILSTAIFSWKI